MLHSQWFGGNTVVTHSTLGIEISQSSLNHAISECPILFAYKTGVETSYAALGSQNGVVMFYIQFIGSLA